MRHGKLESLQILRGIAALSVVLAHYRFYMVPDGGDLTIPNKLFGWGAIGVDLFFVISGFIMVYITKDEPIGFNTWKKFITGRLTRILPTYYTLLLITFLISGAMSIWHYEDKTANLISALTFTPYLNESAPLYVKSDGMYNIRWTLNYEMYFYLIFSICILLGKKITPLITWFAITAFAGYYASGNISLLTSGYKTESVYFNFLTNPIILDFLIGSLTAHLYFFIKQKSNTLRTLTLVFSIVIMLLLAPDIKPYSLHTAISAASLILLFTLYDKEIAMKSPRLLILMGDVSFSWYLVHNPFIHGVADRIDKYYPGEVRNNYGFLVFIVLSFFVACISHKYLEIKLTQKIKGIITKKKETVAT